MNLIDLIEQDENAFVFGSASLESISQSEEELGVLFSEEYAKYLEMFGVAIFSGHELTGLCNGKRLDVVSVTQDQRKYFPEAGSWYVIEEANIDGIVIWQDSEGNIYQTAPGLKPEKIADNLAEYILRY